MKQFLLILIVMLSINMYSQVNRKSAEMHFNSKQYSVAAPELEAVIQKEGENQDLLQMVSDSYYYNSQMQKAEPWFKKLLDQFENSISSEYYFKYAQVLNAVNKNDEAKMWIQKFVKANPDDSRAKNYESQIKGLEDVLKKPQRYTISNSSVNTPYSDFGTSFFGDKVVYTSVKKDGGKIYERTNQPFLDLFVAPFNADGIKSADNQSFSKNLNTKYHDGTATFTTDGKTMYFTRNNSSNDKLKVDKNGVSNLKIFKAQLINGEWSKIEPVPFNNESYSVGHPALSADNKKLYFASDMPGGYGATDIYVVDINADGTYGNPVNLGSSINTEGREMFPFVTKTDLYFSSDGHWGMGSLDVFKVDLSDSKMIPVNMGIPINGPYDDFALIYDDAKKLGFVSSNRTDGNGDDDIYMINAKKCYQSLIGTVTDIQTNMAIPQTDVTFTNRANNEVVKIKSDDNGKFEIPVLDCNSNFNLVAVKENYKTNEMNVNTSDEFAKGNMVDVKLIPEEVIVAVSNVYFDFDKSNIRKDASETLDYLVRMMNKYPKMIVEIKSFTDSRGSVKYNEALSQRRSKSTIDYVLSKGIDSSRINGKGYGESVLVNNCGDGVVCSEADHQLNRRSEIVIIKLK